MPVSEVQRVLGAALMHVPHPDPGAREGEGAGRVNPTAVLVTSCLGLFLIGVNTTAINTALNAIADQLEMGSSALSWAVGIYMLAVAAFVVLGGRLGDLLGERVTFSIGLITFAIGALLVATASGEVMVILGRLVQGLGSATLMPATMAMLRIAFPLDRQGYALGIWGATGGVAFALGPLIGGVLTDEVSWRWVWWGSLIYAGALGFIALGTLRAMPRPTERPRVDYVGVALLALSLFSLILALQEGPDWGWSSAESFASFAVALAAGAALVAVELRTEEPLLHLRLLRMPPLLGALVGTFANSLFLIGLIFFFNLYAQAVVTLDYSAVTASLALLPFGFSMFVASLLVGRVADRFGFRWPVAARDGADGHRRRAAEPGRCRLGLRQRLVGDHDRRGGHRDHVLGAVSGGTEGAAPGERRGGVGDHQRGPLRQRGAGDLAGHDPVRPGRIGRAQRRPGRRRRSPPGGGTP